MRRGRGSPRWGASLHFLRSVGDAGAPLPVRRTNEVIPNGWWVADGVQDGKGGETAKDAAPGRHAASYAVRVLGFQLLSLASDDVHSRSSLAVKPVPNRSGWQVRPGLLCGVGTGLSGLDREGRAVLDATRFDATVDELGMSRDDVGDDQPAPGRAGRAVVSPVPNVIEVPEPGGVNWTMRRPSIGATSPSSRQPRRS